MEYSQTKVGQASLPFIINEDVRLRECQIVVREKGQNMPPVDLHGQSFGDAGTTGLE